MYEFERAAPVTVVLRALRGSVDVTAEDRDGIEVEVQPLDGGDAAPTQVVLDGDNLVIRAPAGRRSPKLRIVARVPAGSSVTGGSAAADVRLAGRYADVQLDVASAAVDLTEATGDVRLDAASGDLTVGRAGGALHLKSASGALHAGDVAGDVTPRPPAAGSASMRSTVPCGPARPAAPSRSAGCDAARRACARCPATSGSASRPGRRCGWT